ncbi:MAG: RIP metalloprotease RseP [Candidatus Aureabacteria bacterium]|nr:RIP metalloprotease RseP [Candidatus Auribacterota bacterium]
MGAEESVILGKLLSSMKFILAFVGVFGVVVFIHELGHFFMAKFFGVKVEEFALGMGPKLFGFKKGETEYKLCAFPIGGYVKMSGEEPEEAKEKTLSKQDYYGQHPFKRFLITFCGPLMNFVLALVLFALIPMIGIYDYPPVIGPVDKGSTAEKAGLLSGDVVISANNKKVRNFSDILLEINESEKTIALEVERDKKVMNFNVEIATEEGENFFREKVDYKTIGVDAFLTSKIKDVSKLKPASFIKLQTGDIITAIGEHKVHFWQDISRILKDNKEGTDAAQFKEWQKIWNAELKKKKSQRSTRIVWLDVERGGKPMPKKAVVLHATKKTMQVKKKGQDKIDEQFYWIIGVERFDESKKYVYSPFKSIQMGMDSIKSMTAFIVKVFGALFQGRLTKQALGGPIMIAKIVNDTANKKLVDLLMLTAVLSLHLGLLNYFPFPALDGGHMAFSILEMIRRKPLALKTMEVIQKSGFAILIGLIIYVSYNDILRLVSGQ